MVTFRSHTAGLHQAIVSIYWVGLFVPPWLLVTGVSRTLLMDGHSSQNHRLSLKKRRSYLLSLSLTDTPQYSFLTNITKSKNWQPSDKETAIEIKSAAVPPYIKGLSEPLCRCLQQHGVRSVFKSDTTPRSQLVRPKDPVDPKQDGVVYNIPCECGKVYVYIETGRCVHERIKEHDRDIRLSWTQTSAVSEHANKTGHYLPWDEVKFIDRDPHCYYRRVNETIHIEAVHIRLHPNNIKRESGIEIPEAWMPTIRQHKSRSLPLGTTEGSVSSSDNTNNALDWNPPTMSEVRDTPVTNNHGGTNSLTQ